jgi:hypothetical protein
MEPIYKDYQIGEKTVKILIGYAPEQTEAFKIAERNNDAAMMAFHYTDVVILGFKSIQRQLQIEAFNEENSRNLGI